MGEQSDVVVALGEAAGKHVDDALDAAIVDGRNRQLGVDGEGDTQEQAHPQYFLLVARANANTSTLKPEPNAAGLKCSET
jgi:hypothetical protein